MKYPVIAIPTPEISRIVQEKLFELGYGWHRSSFIYTCPPNSPQIEEYWDWPSYQWGKEAYIAIYKVNKTINYCDRKYYLEDYKEEFYEITIEDLNKL